MEICMTNDESILLDKYLSNSSNYFEYGGGGSTYFACTKSNINHIYCVESNDQWVNKIKEQDICKKRLNNQELTFFIIQINKNMSQNILANHLLKSENKVYQNNWEKYSNCISNLDTNILNTIDFVLVDGRFRVGCTLMAIKYVNNDCIIAIHDFYFSGKSCNRYETYCVVEKYLDKIEEIGQLVIFKKKENIDYSLLMEDYQKMKYVPL